MHLFIPTDSLLLIFLHYSKHLIDFCCFTKVPNTSKITRFKLDFLPDLQLVFENLVDPTEPICQAIDSTKADMTIFYSSGIEAFVTKNNPKYTNCIIKQLKAYAKSMNLNIPNKKTDSPDEDKSEHDARLLLPTLSNFFKAHPLINPKTFLGNATFDSVCLYKKLLEEDSFGTNETGEYKHFSKAYIRLNSRFHLENQDYTIDENGISCCPNDSSLQMKAEGTSKLRSNITLYNLNFSFFV